MLKLTHTLVFIIIASAGVACYIIFQPPSTSGLSPGGVFTVIVLPDTQKYSERYPEIFMNQTLWVLSQIEARNIVFVSHEGDLVEHEDNVVEWERANASMSVLEGRVPYGVLPGNHDQPTENYNTYFPASRYAGYSWYGGHYGGNDNSYQLFSALGDDYIIMHLEFCPPEDVVEWANGVLRGHQYRKAILVTHGYLGSKGRRSVYGCETQYIYNDIIAPNENVFLVLCGHVHSEHRRVDTVGGRRIHQLLADYQDGVKGGNGWLRIHEFNPSEGQIHVKTYSPYLDAYQTDADSQFTLDYSKSPT
jgi:calcineurin-like phosphoesterase family protein